MFGTFASKGDAGISENLEIAAFIVREGFTVRYSISTALPVPLRPRHQPPDPPLAEVQVAQEAPPAPVGLCRLWAFEPTPRQPAGPFRLRLVVQGGQCTLRVRETAEYGASSCRNSSLLCSRGNANHAPCLSGVSELWLVWIASRATLCPGQWDGRGDHGFGTSEVSLRSESFLAEGQNEIEGSGPLGC